MPTPSESVTSTSEVISDILRTYTETIFLVVKDISLELTDFAVPVSSTILLTTIELIDKIFDLYPVEWGYVQQSINRLNNWINELVYRKADSIKGTLARLTKISEVLISDVTDQLAAIDAEVSKQYNDRMFAIYGNIAELSLAIDAPPSYLEDVIQNGRFFALSVSCSAGLNYYDVLWAWDVGLQRLLTLMKNSISVYRSNPQQIESDIDRVLIKPMFEIYARKAKQETDSLTTVEKGVIELLKSLLEAQGQIDENKQSVRNLFELQVEPAIDQLRDEWSYWVNGIYYPIRKNTETAIEHIKTRQSQLANLLTDVSHRLGLGGDIIDSINLLPDEQRTDQLYKLINTTVSPFVAVQRRVTEQVRRKTTDLDNDIEQNISELKPVIEEIETTEIPVLLIKERTKIQSLFYAGEF